MYLFRFVATTIIINNGNAPFLLRITILSIQQIYEGRTLSHYIDGSDENTASWMRFIRCARHKDEQNLFAFQYNGNIYYRAFKDIPYGTELLVWYDENYPMYMGIPLGVQVDAVFTPSVNTTAQCNSFGMSSASDTVIQLKWHSNTDTTAQSVFITAIITYIFII